MSADTLIASIAEHLAACDLDGRAAFFERLDAALGQHGMCVGVQPVERAGSVHHSADEIEDANDQNAQARRGWRSEVTP